MVNNWIHDNHQDVKPINLFESNGNNTDNN